MRAKLAAIIFAVFLAGCGEDYNRPASPMASGSIATTYAPDGGKVIVMNTPGGGQRQIVVAKDGSIVSDKHFDAPPAPAAAMESVRSRTGGTRTAAPAPSSGRDPQCHPCRQGYTHAPRPGAPCGCGR